MIAASEHGDRETLIKKLGLVRGMLDTFEADDAQIALKELMDFDYGVEDNEKLKNMINLVEEFEYDRAIEVIDSLR